MSGVSLLARFVWYRFENKMRLTKWFVNGYSCNKSGCEINRADIKVTPGDRIEKDLVVVHSKDDQVIPFAHSVNIVSNVTSLIEQSSLPNALRVRFVQLKSAYHDQIVDQSWDEVVPVLREWLSGES
jgi:alpha-beta hydrolase superfamily lysophospholipase